MFVFTVKVLSIQLICGLTACRSYREPRRHKKRRHAVMRTAVKIA